MAVSGLYSCIVLNVSMLITKVGSSHSRRLIQLPFQKITIAGFGRLCRPLDYVDLMPCAYPETLAGTGDGKTTVNIIHKSPSIWKCSRGDIRRPIIVALPVFVRLHGIPTTDLASSGSRQTSEIMMTSYSQLLRKSRTVHGSRDNPLWQLHIIEVST